jgi:hypothetical protein
LSIERPRMADADASLAGTARARLSAAIAQRIAGRSAVRDGLTIAVVLVVLGIYVMCFVAASAQPGYTGRDLAICQREVQAWFGGAPIYPAFEVQGPYQIGAVDLILYPPITTALFAPTLLLPLPLWWLIPAAIVATVVYRLRPSLPWLLALSLCLVYPNSVNLVLAGNPDMWLAAALAVAVFWRPAAAFVLLKPSVFPLALVGFRSRGWWLLAAIFAVASLALLPLTLDWLAVVHNGQGSRSGLLYSYQDIPLIAVPLVAWAGSTRHAPTRPDWLSRRSRRAVPASGTERLGVGLPERESGGDERIRTAE